MNKIKSILLSGLLILTGANLSAQSQSDIRINEVMLHNTNSVQDEYGEKVPWIEIFNSSHGAVQIAGCYLSTDPDNLTMYQIPKGDYSTLIQPLQVKLFWADNQANKGTYHTSLDLSNAKEILFVSSDGKHILHRVSIPKNIPEDKTFGLSDQKYANNKYKQEIVILDNASPYSVNYGTNKESKSEQMKDKDPYGGRLAITAMSVVFLALIILTLVFKFTGKKSLKRFKINAEKADLPVDENTGKASAETYAAISFALHMYMKDNELHDEESFIITQNRTKKNYSPWSSKIYMLRQTPELKRNKR
ncbi:MAG: OadG family transporter subunit [Bacteroidales bacterium]